MTAQPTTRDPRHSLRQWLDHAADVWVRTLLFRQPMAKAYILSAYADAESGGEARFFELVGDYIQDPRLQRLVRLHEADEERHAAAFSAAREALDLPVLPVPSRLRTIERLSERAGHLLERPPQTDSDVVQAYQLLYVVEERALSDFGRAITALERTGDHRTADVLRGIAADEKRHLSYCRSIGRHYAAEGDFDSGLDRFRTLEAQLYRDQAQGTMDHMLRLGLVHLHGLKGWVVRAVLALGGRFRPATHARLLAV